MEKLPWWAVVALAFLGIQYASQRQGSHLEAQDLPSPSRRLMESPAPPEEPTTTPIPFVPPEPPTPPPAWIAPRAAPKEFNLTWQTLPVKQGVLPNMSAIKLTVPCLTFIRFQLIEPCGNLTLPENGILFSTPFGQLQMPGPQSLFHSVKHVEKSLGIYTVCGVVIGIVCWLCFTCCIPDNRHKFFKKVEDIFSGSKIHDFGDDVEEDDEDGDHVEREKSARMDPMSPHFIAPGNIYRLLAVLHPGLIGFQAWFGYAFRGFICGYMQFYLPFNVITNVLTTWECVGIKSPLWFLANLTTFAAMATALGSLSSMFAGKCSKHVLHGAEANMYILSHYNPAHAVDAVDEDEESVESSFDSSLRSNAKSGVIPSRIATTLVRVTADTVEPATEKLREAYVMMERPKLPSLLVQLNALFWCNVSMALNVGMSLMLEFAMFLQVATYTGHIADVAVTAVSLYFIFDLEERVMEADPKLRLRYRHAVATLTEERPKDQHPRILPVVASFCGACINSTVPLGLIGIVLLAWKNISTGFIIGGDGLTL